MFWVYSNCGKVGHDCIKCIKPHSGNAFMDNLQHYPFYFQNALGPQLSNDLGCPTQTSFVMQATMLSSSITKLQPIFMGINKQSLLP